MRVDVPSPRHHSSVAQWCGRIGGPVLAVAAYVSLGGQEGLGDAARAAAAIAVLMAVFWTTEALPLAVTALLPIVLFPLTGVYAPEEGADSPIHRACAPYAHEFIFLFLGGFIIALAIERWGLHRRIALLTLLAVGTRPTRLVAGFMAASAFLSLWISNTATTVLMLPIGTSVVALLAERRKADSDSIEPPPEVDQFSTCLLLSIAYAASIGGLGTLVGTPPNVLLAGFLSEAFGHEIGFGRWMTLGLPVSGIFLLLAWLFLTRVAFRIGLDAVPGGRELIRAELSRMGKMSRGEGSVLVVFLLTASAWVLREPLARWDALRAVVPAISELHDASIALTGALALFFIPVDARRGVFCMDWETARRLPWDVLLLFGGGLSLASAVHSTGLAVWIAEQLPESLPLWALVPLTTALVIFLTEITSNMATASVFLPILGGVAVRNSIDPIWLVVPAALAASCAFMLPVATPPNAIVFGSGQVSVRDMMRAGLGLNLLGVVLIPILLVIFGGTVLRGGGP